MSSPSRRKIVDLTPSALRVVAVGVAVIVVVGRVRIDLGSGQSCEGLKPYSASGFAVARRYPADRWGVEVIVKLRLN